MIRSAAAHGDQWRSPPGFSIRASFFPVFWLVGDTKLPNTSGMIYERPDLKSEVKAALYSQTTRGRPSWLQICCFGDHFVTFGHYLSHKGDYFGNPPPHTSHRPPVYLHQQEASVHTRNSSCEEMALHLQPLLCFDSSSTHRAGFRSASGGGGRGKASTMFSGRHSRQGTPSGPGHVWGPSN